MINHSHQLLVTRTRIIGHNVGHVTQNSWWPVKIYVWGDYIHYIVSPVSFNESHERNGLFTSACVWLNQKYQVLHEYVSGIVIMRLALGQLPCWQALSGLSKCQSCEPKNMFRQGRHPRSGNISSVYNPTTVFESWCEFQAKFNTNSRKNALRLGSGGSEQ